MPSCPVAKALSMADVRGMDRLMSAGLDWAGVVVLRRIRFSYAISIAAAWAPSTALPISSACEVMPGRASAATRFSLGNEWKTQR